MWFRDRQAIFWNFALPVIFISIFGVLNFGTFGSVDLGIVDEADNDVSRGFVEGLGKIDALDVSQGGSVASEREALAEGDRELVLVLPERFGVSETEAEVTLLYNEGRPQEFEVGRTIIRDALNDLNFEAAGVTRLFTIAAESATNRNFSYIDFLLPGVVAMSVMQTGLFSVAFGFLSMKKVGILRRLFATPVHPGTFLFAQVVTRLIVTLIQTLLLVATAVLFFDAEVVGNIASLLFLAIVGSAVFLSMGFAIAGRAKDENAAAPIANLVALPMMFLSGVFFSREFMPDVLQSVTDYLPLTYLADGMRSISSDGASLWSQGGNLLGLAAWFVVSFVVATRLFRWE